MSLFIIHALINNNLKYITANLNYLLILKITARIVSGDYKLSFERRKLKLNLYFKSLCSIKHILSLLLLIFS